MLISIDLKHFKFTYFPVQAHMATKMCVHTLSLSVESTQSLLPSGLPICPGQPASQSPSLPKTCPICQLPKTAQGHSGQNYFIVIQVSILWGPTQAHIFLLSWHSSRMPHSITNFAWSILQLTAEIHCQFK